MTRERLKEIVRKTYEELPGHLQEYVNLRVLQRPVISWTNLTPDQLEQLYGVCCSTRLIFLEM